MASQLTLPARAGRGLRMDQGDHSPATTCKLCGEAYLLPEGEGVGNLPRVLCCGHIYCTCCLESIHCDGVIRCPDCEVEFAVPADGVYALQEDSRIIGLVYTARMNRTKRRWRNINRNSSQQVKCKDPVQKPLVNSVQMTMDEALVQAAETLAQLEYIQETLTTGLANQVEAEKTRLETEVSQAADKAVNAVQKWKNAQLSELANLEVRFLSSQVEVCNVQRRIKALEVAIEKARHLLHPSCPDQLPTLDESLETLQALMDNKSFDMKCINLDSGVSYVFKSEDFNQSLSLFLDMELHNPKPLPGSAAMPCSTTRTSPERLGGAQPAPLQRRDQGRPHGSSFSPSTRPHPRLNHLDCQTRDKVTEKLADNCQKERKEKTKACALPPTGPEMANDRRRIQRRNKNSDRKSVNKRNGPKVVGSSWASNGRAKPAAIQWVVVTFIVNPDDFYVHYVAEMTKLKSLASKIEPMCCGDDCRFTSSDVVEAGSSVFVKWDNELWCRARLVEVFKNGCVEAVEVCPVTQVARLQVFFVDYGYSKSITILSEEGASESPLQYMNNHLRKIGDKQKKELSLYAPRAIRCSLKDLVPYNPTEGWSQQAVLAFTDMVGHTAVEMQLMGQDKDFLLVDLRKAPMDQSHDAAISIREYLTFIKVARFHDSVLSDRAPLPQQPLDSSAEFSAVVTHINHPADFYIQLIDYMESMLHTMALQDYYNGAEASGGQGSEVLQPEMGQIYVARYDNLWYRVQIVALPEAGRVEVQYIDFGNKRILSVSDLREIKDEFLAAPIMSISCRLADVVPLDGETWSDACINRFISLAHQKLITIEPTGNKEARPLPVRLFIPSHRQYAPQVNIAELLVREELAGSREGPRCTAAAPAIDESALWDPPLELRRSRRGSDDSPVQTSSGEAAELPPDCQPLLKLLGRLKDLKVTVSHVNTPGSFYVLLTEFEEQLKRVSERLNEEGYLPEARDVAWEPGMYCAARVDKAWERGLIRSQDVPGGTVEVTRCDHGGTVKLSSSDLRSLPEALTGRLALECTLSDIRPAGGQNTWTATACEIISHLLTETKAYVTIKEETDEHPVPVTLFSCNTKGQLVNIAEFLVTAGLALREKKPRDAVQTAKSTDAESPGSQRQSPAEGSAAAVTRPKPAARIIISAEKVSTELYRPPELPALGHIHMTVTAIGEDGVIYSRTHSAEGELERLRERIKHSMKTLPGQKPYTWKSVLGCAILGTDMFWHRGQLLEVLGGNLKVQYVDDGLVENIPVVHVYPRLLCDDVPQLCLPCQLHNVKPVSGVWHKDAVIFLREALLNRSVDMEVMSLPSDPRETLSVQVFVDGQNFSSVLVQHGYASTVQTGPAQGGLVTGPAILDDWDFNTEGLRGLEEPLLGPFISLKLPQDRVRFPVRIQHLLTPNELFLSPLGDPAEARVEGETLTEALNRLNANIHTLPQLTNFSPGALCLAQYSDRKFYRARLVRVISAEPVKVLVQHVDFGSDDTVPTSRLRQMPAKLLAFPQQLLKVKVAGFRAPRTNRSRDVLPYSPGWSVRAAVDMMELLHSNITASIVAQSPELTVLLYNEDGKLVHLPLVKRGLAELD